MKQRHARREIVVSLLACGTLVCVLTAVACTNSNSGSQTKAARALLEQSTKESPLELTTATVSGEWSRGGRVDGGAPNRVYLYFDGRGAGYAHEAIDDPGVPGEGAPFPFRYVVSGQTVTLNFEDSPLERFRVSRMTAHSLSMDVETDPVWAASTTWVRFKP